MSKTVKNQVLVSVNEKFRFIEVPTTAAHINFEVYVVSVKGHSTNKDKQAICISSLARLKPIFA